MDKKRFFISGYHFEKETYKSPIKITLTGFIEKDPGDWDANKEIMDGLEHGTIQVIFEKVNKE